MAKDGKDLQRLIRAIEAARAAGSEIEIESPKYLVDRVTGEQREHDVVLTIKRAHHKVLVALECRDRSRMVGVPEIEAFQSKCRDTGVDVGIVVSSKGFYRTAKSKASVYGIRCLSLDQASQFNWFIPTELKIFSKHILHVDAQINFPPVLTLCNDQQVVDGLGRPVAGDTINQLAQAALNANHSSLPKALGEHTIAVVAEPDYYVNVDGERFKAVEFGLRVTFENRLSSAPFELRVYSDENSEAEITQAAIANLDVGDLRAEIVASKNEDGSIQVAVVPAQQVSNAPNTKS